MNPLDLIREQRRNAILQGLAVRPRKRCIINLDKIRSIGIVTHGLSDDDITAIEQFSHHMTARGTMVRKLDLPMNADNMIDKYGLPKSDFTVFFTSYQYDLLINATPTDDLFGLYVTLSTSSSLRVVHHDTTLPLSRTAEEAHDLILRGDGPWDLTHLLTQLITFLSQIRK